MDDAIKHPWFKKHIADENVTVNPLLGRNFIHHKPRNILVDVIHRKLIDYISESDLDPTKKQFELFDRSNNGYISKDDFITTMNYAGHKITPNQCEKIFEAVKFDYFVEGMTFSEFVCVSLKSYPVPKNTLK